MINISLFKVRKRTKFYAIVVASVLGYFLLFYPSRIASVVGKTEIWIPSNLKTKVIAQRRGIPSKVLNKLEKYGNTAWEYQSTSHIHTWHGLCGSKLESLLTYPIFPHFPSLESYTDKLKFVSLRVDSGFRLFGFLTVPSSSSYQFKASTLHASMLFWLSHSESPTNMDLVSNITLEGDTTIEHFNKGVVELEAKRDYFFDIVIKTGHVEGVFSLELKDVLEDSYELVDNKFLKTFDHIQSNVMGRKIYYMDEDMNLTVTRAFPAKISESKHDLKRSESYKIPRMSEKITADLLDTCEYSPSYIIRNKKLKYQEGVWETRYISIYPEDFSNSHYYLPNWNHQQVSYGNDILNKSMAEDVVNDVMKIVNNKFNNSLKLLSIVNVEMVNDQVKGFKYLVEIELINLKTNGVQLFSEFVYKPLSGELCYPAGFRSNRSVHVNVIVAIKDQGRWSRYLINSFSKLYKHTKDNDFTLIIVDFNSTDIDFKRALEDSVIPNYILVQHEGNFSRAFGLQAGAASVTDPNQILLLSDLHLSMPMDFLHVARKHTVKGKTGFCPSVFRLLCGATPQYQNGYWEIGGYGIFSVYKSDWDVIGGMNVKEFYSRWGGEDWDMLDRFLNAGYEVERLKLKNFNHYYHPRTW